MQTTLRFDDDLLRQARAEAEKVGVTLHDYIEDALRQRLRNRSGNGRRPHARRIKLPVSRARGGFARGIQNLREAREHVDNSDVCHLLNAQR